MALSRDDDYLHVVSCKPRVTMDRKHAPLAHFLSAGPLKFSTAAYPPERVHGEADLGAAVLDKGTAGL